MPKQIFVNLPVSDLQKSMAFYAALGATNNPQFTDHTAACMVFSDTIFVMLLTHDKWKSFTKKEMVDAHRASEVGLAFTCDDRAAVNAIVEAAGAQGGTMDVNPPEDHGFMFQRSVADPDGHIWEPFFMDMSQFPKSA